LLFREKGLVYSYRSLCGCVGPHRSRGPKTCILDFISNIFSIHKGKAVLLKAWSGPEGSRKLRFPEFITTAQDGVKVVSLTHRPPLPPENAAGTHFC